MAKKTPVRKKKVTKKKIVVPSLEEIDLKYTEPMVDKVLPIAIAWRDQKLLTVLCDDGYLYGYNQTSRKLKKMFKLEV